MSSSPRRALFIKTKNLGDAVIMTSAIAALPQDYKVRIVCFAECAAVYTGLPQVEDVWGVSRGLKGSSAVVESLLLLRWLWNARFQLAAQFSDDWRGALLARFSGAPLRIARQTHRRGSFWHQLFTVIAKVPQFKGRHSADMDVDLLRAARLFHGSTPGYLYPPHFRSSAKQARLPALRDLKANTYVVLHLVSRWSFKELPVETSRLLAREILRRGWRLVVSGDKGDFEKLNEVFLNFSDSEVTLCVGEPIEVFASILGAAKALVSVDSFPIHLGSALGTKIVGIYGPSDERVWRPRSPQHRIISQTDSFTCRPCGLDGCGGGKVSECLRTIDGHAILKELDHLIAMDTEI